MDSLDAPEQLLLLTFEAAGHLFVLDVRRIHELLRPVEVAPLPGAPAAVRGLFDWRGRSLPLVDLQAVLEPGTGLVERPVGRVVVLEAEGHTLGLAVDHVSEVLPLPLAELSGEGQELLAGLSPLVLGCCCIAGRRALMLDVRPLAQLCLPSSPAARALAP